MKYMSNPAIMQKITAYVQHDNFERGMGTPFNGRLTD